MNKPTDGETPTTKPKCQVTIHPAKDGQVQIDFRRLDRPSIPWNTTVPESQVKTTIQQYHEGIETDEERQQELGRQLYGNE